MALIFKWLPIRSPLGLHHFAAGCYQPVIWRIRNEINFLPLSCPLSNAWCRHEIYWRGSPAGEDFAVKAWHGNSSLSARRESPLHAADPAFMSWARFSVAVFGGRRDRNVP
jgi:hypothetical protein